MQMNYSHYGWCSQVKHTRVEQHKQGPNEYLQSAKQGQGKRESLTL